MTLYQALDYAAKNDLLLTFYRKKRTVVIQDPARDMRFEERHSGSPLSPAMAVIRAVGKHENAAALLAKTVRQSEAP